jgi:hypothetical protein
MEVNDSLQAMTALPARKNPGTVEQENQWAREPFWTVWEKRKYFNVTGIQNPDRPTIS